MNLKKDMDPRNGFGFLVAGFLMWALPSLVPDLFPVPLYGGDNGQALWLKGMGFVQILLGGGVVLRHFLIPAMTRRATPRKTSESLPAIVLSNIRARF